MRTKNDQLVTFSNAEPGDLPEILALQYLAYQSEAQLLNSSDIPPLKQSLKEIKEELRDGIILKALNQNDHIVGSVRGKICGETLCIGKLIVRPDMQRLGLGTQLLREIEKMYPNKRCELFTSTKSMQNLALYSRAGYQPFKEKQVSEQLRFVYLEKLTDWET